MNDDEKINFLIRKGLKQNEEKPMEFHAPNIAALRIPLKYLPLKMNPNEASNSLFALEQAFEISTNYQPDDDRERRILEWKEIIIEYKQMPNNEFWQARIATAERELAALSANE